MKILKNNIDDAILKVKASNFKGFLLYGSDLGIVETREKEIKVKLAGFETIKFDLNGESSVKDILNEIYTPSFFGNKKFIHISGNEAKLGNFEEISTALKGFDGFLLCTFYENLDAKSKVRKTCENAVEIGVIACYQEEENDIMIFVSKFFKNKNLEVEMEALKWIISNFKSNRAILNSELEKLATFKIKGKITLADAEKTMKEEQESDIFSFVNTFFSLNIKDFIHEIELLEEDLFPAVLIANLMTYTLKLIEILEEKDLTKKTIDTILTEKFIFFKQIPIMKNHLSKWNLQRLHNLLGILINLDIEVKKGQGNAYSIMKVQLISIAKSFG
jgi:DNA polymerase III delta subunit